jgi:hypothetical protein
MTVFVLAPGVLGDREPTEDAAAVPLDFVDDPRDYDNDSGSGCWIRMAMDELAGLIERTFGTRIVWQGRDRLSTEFMACIDSVWVRNRVVAFLNLHYEDWREHGVEYGNSDGASERAFGRCCDGCDVDGAWDITYSEYEGPFARDVEADEDEDVDDPEEQEAIRARNRDRRRLRIRYQDDEAGFEGEEVDRTCLCEDHCEHYWEAYDECIEENTEVDLPDFRRRWNEYFHDMPKIVELPPLHSPGPVV